MEAAVSVLLLYNNNQNSKHNSKGYSCIHYKQMRLWEKCVAPIINLMQKTVQYVRRIHHEYIFSIVGRENHPQNAIFQNHIVHVKQRNNF